MSNSNIKMVPFLSACALWAVVIYFVGSHFSKTAILSFMADGAHTFRWLCLVIGTLPLFLILALTDGPLKKIGWGISKGVGKAIWGVYPVQEKLSDKVGEFVADFVCLPWFLTSLMVVGLPIQYTWPLNAIVGIQILFLLLAWSATEHKFYSRKKPLEKHKQAELFGRAASATLIPLSVGAWAVMYMQLIFNLFDSNVDAIRKYETHLAYVSQASDTYLDFSTPISILLALSFVLLAFIFPRWKAASRLMTLKEWSARTVAIVAAVSSFVFLQQAPSKYEEWKEHQLIQAEKADNKVNDWSNKMAIKTVANTLLHLPPNRLSEYRERFEVLEDHVPYPQHDGILKLLAKPVGPTEVVGISANSVAAVQGSLDYAAETTETLKNLFCELIGAITPEIKGIAGKFVEHLVDAESERIFDVYVKKKIQKPVEELLKVEAARELTILNTNSHPSESESEEMARLQREIDEMARKIEHDKVEAEIKENMEHPAEEVP